MQKVNKPDVVCEDPEETVVPESCSEHVSPQPRCGWGLWGVGRAGGVSSPTHARLLHRPPSAPSASGC